MGSSSLASHVYAILGIQVLRLRNQFRRIADLIRRVWFKDHRQVLHEINHYVGFYSNKQRVTIYNIL